MECFFYSIKTMVITNYVTPGVSWNIVKFTRMSKSSRRVKHPWQKMRCNHLMIPLIFSNLDWWALDFRCFYSNSISHLVQVISNLRFWQRYCVNIFRWNLYLWISFLCITEVLHVTSTQPQIENTGSLQQFFDISITPFHYSISQQSICIQKYIKMLIYLLAVECHVIIHEELNMQGFQKI